MVNLRTGRRSGGLIAALALPLLMTLGLLAGGGVASAQVQRVSTATPTCPSDYTGGTTPCSNTTLPPGTAPPSGPVAGGTSGVSAPTNSSGPLAFTGANIFRLLLAAAVLLLIGLVLVAVTRERRRIRR